MHLGIYIYHWFGLIKHIPLLLCIESLLNSLYIDLHLLSKLSLWTNLSLIIACSSFIVEICHKTSQLALYSFGL